jgi:heptosyltransferase-2
METNILILKLGATGDVVRTTALLRRIPGEITWITASKNVPLLTNIDFPVRVLSWEQRELAKDRCYDLAISLEDTADVAEFLASAETKQIFGARAAANGGIEYTDDSREWFDLSLISRFGRQEADRLKYLNRRTYQDLIFAGLGYKFKGEQYVLPVPAATDLTGDIAIASESGPVWPMKKWAYYEELKQRLEAEGFTVNYLPQRKTLLEHLADVRNHRFLVGGDSLPMHFALGNNIPCVSIFTCTSPWEIYDYGIQTKIVSPLLGEFFYKRGFEARATKANSVEEVYPAVLNRISALTPAVA